MVIGTFFSCQKDTINPDPLATITSNNADPSRNAENSLNSTANLSTDSLDYPAAIDTYIASNYPDANIISVSEENDGYEVSLDNDLDVLFDAQGQFINEETDLNGTSTEEEGDSEDDDTEEEDDSEDDGTEEEEDSEDDGTEEEDGE